jgi:hypothetical protein
MISRKQVSANTRELRLTRFIILFIFVSFLQIPIVNAMPILQLDSNYQLLGARGVIIDGWSYDVRFIDSSCDILWRGCDRNRFLFKSEYYARLASQALLDQVFLDFAPHLPFDTVPWATNGITASLAQVWTPFGTYSEQGRLYVNVIHALNFDGIDTDAVIGPGAFKASHNTMTNDAYPQLVYAYWTVPEPSVIALLACSILMLAIVRGKHQHTIQHR